MSIVRPLEGLGGSSNEAMLYRNGRVAPTTPGLLKLQFRPEVNGVNGVIPMNPPPLYSEWCNSYGPCPYYARLPMTSDGLGMDRLLGLPAQGIKAPSFNNLRSLKVPLVNAKVHAQDVGLRNWLQELERELMSDDDDKNVHEWVQNLLSEENQTQSTLLQSNVSGGSLNNNISSSQEKRGYFFCPSDRANLCKDCDASIHSANEIVSKHTRFLVTGIRASSAKEEEPIKEIPKNKKQPERICGENPSKKPRKATELNSATNNSISSITKNSNNTSSSVTKNSVVSLASSTISVVPEKTSSSTSTGESNQMSFYFNEVEEFLASNLPDKLDWFSMSAPSYQDKDSQSIWSDVFSSNQNYFAFPPSTTANTDSLAQVPHPPSAPTGLFIDHDKLVMNNLYSFNKPKARLYSETLLSSKNDCLDESFTVPDIEGYTSSVKRTKLIHNLLPDRFL